MKFIVSIFFVLIHLITSAQNNIQKSIIGKWKVIKIISLDNTIDFENNEQISKLNVPFVYINFTKEGFEEFYLDKKKLYKYPCKINYEKQLIETLSENSLKEMLLEKTKFHFNEDILILEKYFENEEEKQIVELVKSEN